MTTVSVNATVDCNGVATVNVQAVDVAEGVTVTSYELWGTVTGAAGSVRNSNGQFTVALQPGEYTTGGSVTLSNGNVSSNSGPIISVGETCEQPTTTITEATTTTVNQQPTTTTTTVMIEGTTTTVSIPGVTLVPATSIVSTTSQPTTGSSLPRTGAGDAATLSILGFCLVAAGAVLLWAGKRGIREQNKS